MDQDPLFVCLHHDIEAANQSLLGLIALHEELKAQGVDGASLFAGTGVHERQLEDADARISHRQRLHIYRNAVRLARRPGLGLHAGQRQRISDFGAYGFAMMASRSFGDALRFSVEHVRMAGAVVEISLTVREGQCILRSHQPELLGELLPFVAEFWRSSMTVLFSCVLGSPFPSKKMLMPYRAPVHWREYEHVLGCPVEFGTDRLEWHFDAAVLDRPCPNGNAITYELCKSLCRQLMDQEAQAMPELPQLVRSLCLECESGIPHAGDVADQLGMSLRTLHRKLAGSGFTFLDIANDVRRRRAIQLLENTSLSMEQVAERTGFSDAASFRRSFRKWTGQAPKAYRAVP